MSDADRELSPREVRWILELGLVSFGSVDTPNRESGLQDRDPSRFAQPVPQLVPAYAGALVRRLRRYSSG